MNYRNFKIKIILSLLIIFTNYKVSVAQNSEVSIEIKWDNPIVYGLEGEQNETALHFENAQYDFSTSALPFLYLELGSFSGKMVSSITLTELNYELLSAEQLRLVDNKNEIPTEFETVIENGLIKKRSHSYLRLNPFRRNSSGQIERLLSFSYNLKFQASRARRNKALTFADQSLLSGGDWFKIAVPKRGVYKLKYNFLKNLGLDVDNINPRDIRLFGYGAGQLPASNSVPRPDDMQENAIQVIGESDGKFDKQDFILFYGEGQVSWNYDSTKDYFLHNKNIYSDTGYYFISTSLGAGKRIVQEQRPQIAIENTVIEFDDYQFHELDAINLLKSGQLWLGESFDNKLSYTFSFPFSGVNTQEKAKSILSVAARSGLRSSFTLSDEDESKQIYVGTVGLNNYAGQFAKSNSLSSVGTSVFEFNPSGNNISINILYDKPQTVSQGWLNFLTVNVRRSMSMNQSQLFFRDSRTVNSSSASAGNEFIISGSNVKKVWDLTNKYDIIEKNILKTNNSASIIAGNSILREFVALNNYDSTSVIPLGRVENQNLHGLPQADMIIVTYPGFISQANRLATIHRNEGLEVNVATTHQVFNEFSSGSQDIIAIRTFMKMFYDRASNDAELPKYLLLFGDGSFEFKNRVVGNTNKVPSFQSVNSFDPVESYVSDDYVALLDDSEGRWSLGGEPEKLDVGVGRFPVNTAAEADGVVNKVERYYSAITLRDWRNTVTFVGDDEDGKTHMIQSNELSKILDDNHEEYNHNKIFLDAFQQESSASGTRYPEANKAINNAVQQGTLFMNYTGHGGETGWTEERVLGVSDIFSWNNLRNMPVFVTATCEFSRFDDPFRQSAGEMVLTNAAGGGIALLTTTRLVYSSPNYILNRTFYNNIFKRKSNGETKRLGDIFQEVKNGNARIGNTRNFSLLGDPALKIAIPEHQTVVSNLNGQPISQVDTLNALSKVTITGFVADQNGNKINDFNGFVYPTIFDKKESLKTLGQDDTGEFSYEARNSRIFKGKASVVNGSYSYSFIVPKDISYSYGNGKISEYAENGVTDANGYSTSFVIGGSNPNAISDKVGPEMEIFMNDESFVYGGITDANPMLLVKLSDSLGINTVGNGIGHDLVAILDENTEEAFVLNEYYEAELDDYTQGEINFPLEGLTEGKHSLRIKAWDVANNSSEKTIEFTVLENKEVKIDNLVNYPNPFTTNTEFIFQHNQAGVPLDVKLEIFTVSGKLVKSFNELVINDGFISRDIRWNGRDDFGDKIGKGVYVYKLKVRSRNGSSAEKFEKLVIL